jgi:hypothetical protein
VVLPLLQTLIEGFFWNGVQLRRRLLYDILAVSSILGKPEITRSHVRREGSLVSLWKAMLGQETLDQVS